MGAPAVDLTDRHAFARTTDPEVELPVLASQTGTIRGARRAGGQLRLDLDGRSVAVGAADDGVRRLGDAASGLLYPTDYLPASDAALRGHRVTLRAYRETWGGTFQVAWVE